MGPQTTQPGLVMDRAYEGNETGQLACDLGPIPVVPPLKTGIDPWEYNRELYRRRNAIERLFRRLKGHRRIFSPFEKLDGLLLGLIHFVLIFDALLSASVNRPQSGALNQRGQSVTHECLHRVAALSECKNLPAGHIDFSAGRFNVVRCTE